MIFIKKYQDRISVNEGIWFRKKIDCYKEQNSTCQIDYYQDEIIIKESLYWLPTKGQDNVSSFPNKKKTKLMSQIKKTGRRGRPLRNTNLSIQNKYLLLIILLVRVQKKSVRSLFVSLKQFFFVYIWRVVFPRGHKFLTKPWDKISYFFSVKNNVILK